MKRPAFFPVPILFLLLLAPLTAGTVLAQPAAAPRPASGVTAGVRETRLPNGLKVLTKEVRNAPVVSFAVWYKVGSRNEHTGITGVSHLLEHMLFKGTKRYALGEISRTLFVNGAEFNASTYYDWTNYYQTLASDRLELAMQIESDRMVNSRIDAADLRSEMTVVRSELEGRENDPEGLLFQAVQAAAFQAHPYQWPVIGWRSDVENVPRDAIHRYYKTHYGPNNATVVIVGDFQTARALALVRKYFGALPRIPAVPRVYTAEPPQRGERRVTVRRAGSLPIVLHAYKSPPANSPDFYSLDALQMILGTGRTSRLYQNLVETQIAVSAGASAQSMRDPYLFIVSASGPPGSDPAKLDEALDAEVEKLRDAPVSAEELARAKSVIEAQFVFQNDSVTEQATQLGYWAMVDDWKYLNTYLERIRALTPGDLQRVAGKYFVQDARTVGHFIPTSDAAPVGPPPIEASARVEKPRRGDRPVPLPKPVKTGAARRAVSRFRLENGVSVVVNENRANPTFALRGSLAAGSIMEPEDKPGLARLTAAMLTRGTANRTAREFAAALEDVGASLSASGGELSTSITGQGQSKDFDRVMDLLAEMLREPAFPADVLQRLKSQTLAGIEQARDDPASLAGLAFERSVYPEGHLLRPETLDDSAKAIRGMTRDDVAGFFRSQYGPEGMILVITGDVKADRVRTALSERLGSWPRNTEAKKVPPPDVPLQTSPARITIQVPDKSETAIVWGHAGGLRRGDPDFYPTQVFNLILGGGGALNSRLGNTIRDEQGLVYTVFSFFESDRYPGPFQVSLGTNPANAAQAVKSLEAEIRRIRERGVTQREVDEAVAYLTGRFPLRLETNSGMAEVLWIAEYYNLGPDYIDRYGDLYRAVTVAQVNAAAKKHVHPDRATLVISGTLPQAAAPK